jgi:glucose/mannose-6-phosphate isomerase
LIDKKSLEKYDSKKMFEIYDKWPKIANDAYNSKNKTIEFTDIEHIVFAGMGGSGAVGDIFSSILSKTNIHVTIVKGYLLPKTVDSKSLIITTSVSGNSVESLTILESAKKINCKIVAFASGGKMEKYCKENKIEFRKINQIHSPRASFTQFLFAMLKVLEPVLPLQKKDIEEAINGLNELSKEICSANLNNENLAVKIAKKIDGIPLIYYPSGLQAAAIRFKNNLQENSKTHAIIEDVIEACHNGVVAWEKTSNVTPILIIGNDDYIKTKERWNVLKEYFKLQKINYQEIFSNGDGILSKLVNLIYLLDYVTIYHAINLNIDPSPVKSIEFIKSEIQNKKNFQV